MYLFKIKIQLGYLGNLELKKSDNNVSYAVRIEKKDKPIECLGSLIFTCMDPHVQVEMLMKLEGGRKNVQ